MLDFMKSARGEARDEPLKYKNEKNCMIISNGKCVQSFSFLFIYFF